ncbi:MAG TPA: tyrosine-protein phosphatase [Candidatus Acidoferrales bacterium]|nr:tyrosine-protein phosphatase [Candidatus Acidoferrales bacterium]
MGLLVDGLVNVRDLGGMPTESGATTLPGRLIRSESPHTLTDDGLRDIVDLGIGTVVDLRTASEREKRPSPLVEAGVRTVHAPIFTDDEEYPDHLATAGEVYCWWLRERRTGVALAMNSIAGAPSAPVLVHCHAGKDRTGVVIGMVLRLAGVSIADIADDYALSGMQLVDMLARDRITAVERGMDPVRVERLFTVPRDAMVETMECIDLEHGGVASLLRNLGLDDARIDRLRNLLLSRNWP